MKSFHHLLKINSLICLILVLISVSVFAQNEKQQMRLAKSLEKNHEYEAALKIYKNLDNNIKTRSNARLGIQNCLKGLRQYDELVIFLKKIVDENKSNNRNVNALAEAYLLNSEKDKAINLWKSLLNNRRNDIGVYRMVAGSMIKNRMMDNAVEVYELALVNLKNQQILHLDLANLHKSMLNMDKAALHFLAYYGNYPKQKTFLQRQILNLTKSEQHVESVANVLNDFIVKQPKKLFIKEILGGLYIKSKQFNRAFDIYNSLEDSKKDGSYLFQFGREAQKNQAYDFAVQTFNKILENDRLPIYANAYFQLAKTYNMIALENREENESIAKAIKMFETLVAKNSIQNFSDLSCVLLGDIYLDFYFDLDKSIQYYGYVSSKYPKSKKLSESLIKLGDSYLIKGNLKQSQKSYANIKDKNSFSIATFKSAELEYYQGNFADALKNYNLIIEKKGTTDSLANNALERTIFINSYKSDSLDLKSYAHGELLIFQQKYSEAVEHLNKLVIKQNNISSSAGKVIANILMKLEKYAEANTILTELIEQYPEDYFVDEFLFKSAVIEEILGNYQKSFELYQIILNNYDTSLYYEKAREKARLLSEIIKKEQVSG